MPTFKFDSASCFLTYAQSNLTHDAIYEKLRSIGDVVWARICTEQHADGQPHQHAVAKFSKRVQSRDVRLFDIAEQHPNIQPIRSIKRALEYVTKEGEFSDYGTVPSGEGEDIDWMAAAATHTEPEYYKMALSAKVPFMYAKRFWDLGSKTTTHEITDAFEPDLTRECLDLLVRTPSTEQSTVVIGPTGCGKTSWAKRNAQKPALWVRHMDVLRAFRPGYHKSVIFDDMSFLHLPREAQIHITDTTDEAHIHCRYGYAVIPAGVQKIFTANSYPFIQDEAIDRRVYAIVITNTI